MRFRSSRTKAEAANSWRKEGLLNINSTNLCVEFCFVFMMAVSEKNDGGERPIRDMFRVLRVSGKPGIACWRSWS